MELQKILAYQDIDKKVYACELELKQSKTAQEYAKAMTMYKSRTEDMMKSIREADEVAVLAERYKQTYKNILDEINGLNEVLDSFEELKEIDKYEKKIAQFQKELLNIERELTRLSKKMDECIDISKKSLDDLKKLEDIIKVRKIDMQKIKTEIEGKAKGYLIELKKLQSELPSNLVEKYNQIRKNNTYINIFHLYIIWNHSFPVDRDIFILSFNISHNSIYYMITGIKIQNSL